MSTNKVCKWKARLNVHGGKHKHGVNCWETCTPTIVGWLTMRLFLNLMPLNDRTSRQVDFVVAFPQTDTECDMHTEVPIGFEVDGNRKHWCLRLRRDLCSQWQASKPDVSRTHFS